jgi:hypothetical protein
MLRQPLTPQLPRSLTVLFNEPALQSISGQVPFRDLP